MKVNREYQSLILTAPELSTLRKHIGETRNLISIPMTDLPALESRSDIISSWNAILPEQQLIYQKALLALNEPLQTASFAYTISEQRLYRASLAWLATDPQLVATLDQQENELNLAVRSSRDLQQLMTEVLAIDDSLLPANINVGVSSAAMFVLLSAFEGFYETYYQSLLSHSVPQPTFSLEEIITRLQNSNHGDFRWPMGLFVSVLPQSAWIVSKEEAIQAIGELEEAGWLLRLDDDDDESKIPLFMLSGLGENIANSFLHHISVCVLCLTRLREDGKPGQEAFLLIRDPSFLWLVDISGKESLIANMTLQEWNIFSTRILMPGEDLPIAVQTAIVSETPRKVTCPSCKAEIPSGKAFCIKCGASLVTRKEL